MRFSLTLAQSEGTADLWLLPGSGWLQNVRSITEHPYSHPGLGFQPEHISQGQNKVLSPSVPKRHTSSKGYDRHKIKLSQKEEKEQEKALNIFLVSSLFCSVGKSSCQESEVSGKWSNDLIPTQEGQVFSSRSPENVVAENIENQEANPSAL